MHVLESFARPPLWIRHSDRLVAYQVMTDAPMIELFQYTPKELKHPNAALWMGGVSFSN
jgi:hypothetical protein